MNKRLLPPWLVRIVTLNAIAYCVLIASWLIKDWADAPASLPPTITPWHPHTIASDRQCGRILYTDSDSARFRARYGLIPTAP